MTFADLDPNDCFRFSMGFIEYIKLDSRRYKTRHYHKVEVWIIKDNNKSVIPIS